MVIKHVNIVSKNKSTEYSILQRQSSTHFVWQLVYNHRGRDSSGVRELVFP